MDISTIIFFISLFIMLTAAISTEIIRSRRMRAFYVGILFLNSICLISGVAIFIWSHSVIYMVAGTAFSLVMLGVTYFKYSDFSRGPQ